MANTPIVYKIRFCKKGDLRYISHHDMMRLWERAVRRVELPIEMSQGFNPRPRISYSLALEVGIAGLDEVLNVRLSEWLHPHAVQGRLQGALPEGMEITDVRTVSRRDSSEVDHTCYGVRLLSGHRVCQSEVDRLLAQREVLMRRIRRGKTVEKNIRPYLRALKLSGDNLEIMLQVTPTGTARPDEVLEALGCTRGKDYLINQIIRTRVALVSPA